MKEYATEYTREEQIVSQLARLFNSDDRLVIATMNNAGFVSNALAQRLYAPRVCVYMDAGGGKGTGALLTDPGLRFPFMVGHPPEAAITAPLHSREIFDLLIGGKWNILMQPAQIDKFGNMNISAIGDWRKPTATLVGARGVPDNTTNGGRVYYYVPEHTSRVFVEKVDIICGVGYGPEREREREKGVVKWGAVERVISNMGVFDFDEKSKRMRLTSVHTGVTVQQVVDNTSFELLMPDPVPETESPSVEEIHLMREVIDPAGIKRLDFVKGDDFKKVMGEIMKGTTYSMLYPRSSP